MRRYLRLLYMGLSTVLGIKQLGFFIPYRYAGITSKHKTRLPYPWIEDYFKSHEGRFLEILSAITNYSEELTSINDDHPPAPRWKQEWFPGLDGAITYTMVRTFKPEKIVEVGSGHSTRFMMRAINDGELNTRITAIDPAPRADITRLDITLITETVQNADHAAFESLRSGDIISIDSSHILMPGSDVDLFFNSVLPNLPDGVIIHIHDIFLPDDYPAQWQWRGYNEQLVIPSLLQDQGYELLWSSRYVRTRISDKLKGPLFDHINPPDDGLESSLWLVKKSYS